MNVKKKQLNPLEIAILKGRKSSANKEFRNKNPDYWKNYIKNKKKACLRAYGAKCRFCGETDLDKLCIHFSRGDRDIHRVNTGKETYLYLERNGYPKNLGVICACLSCVGRIHREQVLRKRGYKP